MALVQKRVSVRVFYLDGVPWTEAQFYISKTAGTFTSTETEPVSGISAESDSEGYIVHPRDGERGLLLTIGREYSIRLPDGQFVTFTLPEDATDPVEFSLLRPV